MTARRKDESIWQERHQAKLERLELARVAEYRQPESRQPEPRFLHALFAVRGSQGEGRSRPRSPTLSLVASEPDSSAGANPNAALNPSSSRRTAPKDVIGGGDSASSVARRHTRRRQRRRR